MITTKWFQGDSLLEDAHAVRRKVFIEEQNISEADEMDGTDVNALHLVVYDGKRPVATGRLIFDGDGQPTLGRVAVLKEERGNGYGGLLMRMLIRKCCELGYRKQYVHAQITARGFYETLGFAAFGDVYEDAGIPHISMAHEGDVSGCCGKVNACPH